MTSNSTTTGFHALKVVPTTLSVSSNVRVKVPSMSSLLAVNDMAWTSAVPPDVVLAYMGCAKDGDRPSRSTLASAYV